MFLILILFSKNDFFNVSNYMSALCLLLQILTWNTYNIQQFVWVFFVRNLKCPLDNVVCLNVSHQLQNLKHRLLQEFPNDITPLLFITIHKTLLDHIGSLLGQTHEFYFASHCLKHLMLLLFGEFQNMLNGIVPILVFTQLWHEWKYFLNNRFDHERITVFQHPLNHSATISVDW